MRSLGISVDSIRERREQFLDLFGTWSKKDEKNFRQYNKVFEKIDKRDWV